MGVNVNNNEIKKMVFDTKYESNFPKNKAGKNDRVGMVDGMEHGHKYYGTLTVTYADWSEYKTTLTVEKLLQNREWVQVRDTGEGRFGTFVLLFNSLLAGTFKNEAQKQSDSYFEKIEEMNAQVNKANKETEEQKAIVNKLSLDNSLLKADKALLEGQLDNALMVIDTKDKEIVKLNSKIDLLNSKISLEKITQNITYDDRALDKFIQITETLVNAKISHEQIKVALEKNFKDLFLK